MYKIEIPLAIQNNGYVGKQTFFLETVSEISGISSR